MSVHRMETCPAGTVEQATVDTREFPIDSLQKTVRGTYCVPVVSQKPWETVHHSTFSTQRDPYRGLTSKTKNVRDILEQKAVEETGQQIRDRFNAGFRKLLLPLLPVNAEVLTARKGATVEYLDIQPFENIIIPIRTSSLREPEYYCLPLRGTLEEPRLWEAAFAEVHLFRVFPKDTALPQTFLRLCCNEAFDSPEYWNNMAYLHGAVEDFYIRFFRMLGLLPLAIPEDHRIGDVTHRYVRTRIWSQLVTTADSTKLLDTCRKALRTMRQDKGSQASFLDALYSMAGRNIYQTDVLAKTLWGCLNQDTQPVVAANDVPGGFLIPYALSLLVTHEAELRPMPLFPFGEARPDRAAMSDSLFPQVISETQGNEERMAFVWDPVKVLGWSFVKYADMRAPVSGNPVVPADLRQVNFATLRVTQKHESFAILTSVLPEHEFPMLPCRLLSLSLAEQRLLESIIRSKATASRNRPYIQKMEAAIRENKDLEAILRTQPVLGSLSPQQLVNCLVENTRDASLFELSHALLAAIEQGEALVMLHPGKTAQNLCGNLRGYTFVEIPLAETTSPHAPQYIQHCLPDFFVTLAFRRRLATGVMESPEEALPDAGFLEQDLEDQDPTNQMLAEAFLTFHRFLQDHYSTRRSAMASILQSNDSAALPPATKARSLP